MKNITVRGRTFTGVVVGTKMAKTATIEWEYQVFLQKYERYEKKMSRVKAHNEMNAKKGDIVVKTPPSLEIARQEIHMI